MGSNKTSSCSRPYLQPRFASPALGDGTMASAEPGCEVPAKHSPTGHRAGPARARLAPYLAKRRSRALPRAAARWSRVGAGRLGGPGGPYPTQERERGGAPARGSASRSLPVRPLPPALLPGTEGTRPGRTRRFSAPGAPRGPRGPDRVARAGAGTGAGGGVSGGGGTRRCEGLHLPGFKARAGRRRACPGESCARVTVDSNGHRH